MAKRPSRKGSLWSMATLLALFWRNESTPTINTWKTNTSVHSTQLYILYITAEIGLIPCKTYFLWHFYFSKRMSKLSHSLRCRINTTQLKITSSHSTRKKHERSLVVSVVNVAFRFFFAVNIAGWMDEELTAGISERCRNRSIEIPFSQSLTMESLKIQRQLTYSWPQLNYTEVKTEQTSENLNL